MDESPEINEPIETKTARHKVKPKKPNHRTETKGLKKTLKKDTIAWIVEGNISKKAGTMNTEDCKFTVMLKKQNLQFFQTF